MYGCGFIFLSPEEALSLLKIGPEYTQVALRTEKAVAQLRWLRAETLVGLPAEDRQREQEAYQEAFAKKMEGMESAGVG